jgi:hypothetical protein
MLKVDGRDLDRAAAKLRQLHQASAKAASRVLNDAAFAIAAAERTELARVFDRPTAWTLRSVRVTKATPSNPTAVVGSTDRHAQIAANRAGFITKWARVVGPHVYAGGRAIKAHEQRLQAANILPIGWWAVPGAGIRRDSHGNVTGAEFVQLLSWVGAMGMYEGDNRNRRDRQRRRRNLAESRGESYFVVKPGSFNAHLEPGIYKRKANRSIVPILIFVSDVQYRARLDWFGVANRVAADVVPKLTAAALEAALK